MMRSLSLSPSELSTSALQSILQHGVAPRPICLASTVSEAAEVNLSPFSFFNLFSTAPPICIFSPARRVRDNTTKHTLENVLEVPEVVINVVNYSMVHQVSLASTEYPRGVNEFEKAGLTMVASDLVRPPRVQESPMQLECRVIEVKALGQGPGAGNLIIAEVIKIHIREDVLNDKAEIDQVKMDLVARLGANWYCRANKDALFEVEKPLRSLGIGVDALPMAARNSSILTGSDLGRLGNMERLPTEEQIAKIRSNAEIIRITNSGLSKGLKEVALHRVARRYIKQNDLEKALAILWLAPLHL